MFNCACRRTHYRHPCQTYPNQTGAKGSTKRFKHLYHFQSLPFQRGDSTPIMLPQLRHSRSRSAGQFDLSLSPVALSQIFIHFFILCRSGFTMARFGLTPILAGSAAAAGFGRESSGLETPTGHNTFPITRTIGRIFNPTMLKATLCLSDEYSSYSDSCPQAD